MDKEEGILSGNGDIVLKAIDFAAIRHNGKNRKNPEMKIPYIVHPLKVGMMLREAGFDDEVVASGILHDTVEDTATSIEEIEAEFGRRVAGFVGAVTEPDKNQSWKVRQAAYLRSIEASGREVLSISACDKIDNMRSLLQGLKAGFNVYSGMNAPAGEQIEKFERLMLAYRDRVPSQIEGLYFKTLAELIEVTDRMDFRRTM